MKKDASLDVDRQERAYYLGVDWTTPIKIPTTYDGFETLVERVAEHFGRPVADFDDNVRSGMCGYIHSIDRFENTITLETLAKVMWRALGLKLSWVINETIRIEKAERAEQAKEKMKSDGFAKKKQARANKYAVKSATNEAETN